MGCGRNRSHIRLHTKCSFGAASGVGPIGVSGPTGLEAPEGIQFSRTETDFRHTFCITLSKTWFDYHPSNEPLLLLRRGEAADMFFSLSFISYTPAHKHNVCFFACALYYSKYNGFVVYILCCAYVCCRYCSTKANTEHIRLPAKHAETQRRRGEMERNWNQISL